MNDLLALDALALRAAHRIAASQPKCDYTIAQLPPLASGSSTDLLPIFHNGSTYGIEVGNLPVISAVGADVNLSGLGIYNVKNYGALGDGTTDDSAAVCRAITAMVAIGSGILYYPEGTYRQTLVDIPNTSSGAYFVVGAGIGVTILKGNAVADHVLGHYANGGVSNLTVDGNAQTINGLITGTLVGGPAIDSMRIANVKCRNINPSTGVWTLICWDQTQTFICNTVYLNNVICEGPTNPANDMFATAYIDTVFVNNIIFRNASRTPNFYYVNRLFIDGCQVLNISGGNSLVIDLGVLSAQINNLYVDSLSGLVVLNGKSINFSNTDIITDQPGASIEIGPSATTVQNISIANSRINGIEIASTLAANPLALRITNSHLYTTGTGTGSVIYDAHTSGEVDGIEIQNCSFDSSNTLHLLQSNSGATWGKGHISNCRLIAGSTGIQTLSLLPTFAIRNLIGITPAGQFSPQPAVPSSTVAYTNATNYDCMVTIATGAGVTVSHISIGGNDTGQTMVASSFAVVLIPVGQSITLTYSGGTPSWVWMGL